MMKWKIFSIMLAVPLVLGACGTNNDGGNDNGTGTDQNNDDNVEQTRFNGDGNTDNMNDRNNNNNEFNNGDRTRNTDERGNNGNNGDRSFNEDQYEMADEAADRITDQVDGIDNSYVIKTDNNAYVAAELDQDNDNNNADNNNTNMNGTTNNNDNNNEGGELTDDVKQEITDVVKSVDPDVDNVYVSTNPDFFDLAGNYADDVDSGEPVEGLFDQMGNMIERVFPEQNNNN